MILKKIVKKLQESGAVTDIFRPVHHGFTKNIAAICEIVAEDLNESIRHRSLFMSILWHIMANMS